MRILYLCFGSCEVNGCCLDRGSNPRCFTTLASSLIRCVSTASHLPCGGGVTEPGNRFQYGADRF